MRTIKALSVWILFILFYAAVGATAAFPLRTGTVTDTVGIFLQTDRQNMEQVANELRQTNGAEIAVVVIPSLEGANLESYANQLFKRWGIGQKRENNGVLLLVVISDRVMRIEVGYGLEARLTDGLCGEIIRQTIAPPFKRKDYAAGVLGAMKRIALILRSPAAGDSSSIEREYEKDPGPPSLWMILPFFGVFVVIGSFMLGAGLASKTFFPTFFGLFFGGMPLLMSFAFLGAMHAGGRMAILPLLYATVTAFGYRKVSRSPKLRESFRGAAGGSSPGWIAGSTGGGGSRSGGSSSGGGSSGGGGASGSW